MDSLKKAANILSTAEKVRIHGENIGVSGILIEGL